MRKTAGKKNPMHSALRAKISPCNLHSPKTWQPTRHSTQTMLVVEGKSLSQTKKKLHTYHRFALFFFHNCLQKAGEIHLFKKTWGSYFSQKIANEVVSVNQIFFHQTVHQQIRTWYKVGPCQLKTGVITPISRVTPVTPITFGHFPMSLHFFCGSRAHPFFSLGGFGNTPIASCVWKYIPSQLENHLDGWTLGNIGKYFRNSSRYFQI